MVAHMNDEALRKTIASGEAWYFSRSRKALWRKGRDLRPHPARGRDAAWIAIRMRSGSGSSRRARPVTPAAAPASTARSTPGEGGARLSFVDADRLFDPKEVYRT